MSAANPIQSRCDLHAPCVQKTFAASTAADLTGVDAPRNAQHLPCGVIVIGGSAVSFVWKDVNGTQNSILVPAGAWYLPIAAAELVVTNACVVTVCWQSRLNAKL